MTNVKTPWHLWVVGILALLFTAFGGYDYVMSQLGDRAYMEQAVGSMGIDVDVALEYFSNFPFWMDAVWAIGVWSGVAGAVLLLMRSGFAYYAFVLSLVGLVISNSYGFIEPLPGVTDPTPTYIAIATVFVVMLAFTIYARAMARGGVLG